jgi:hypothetical protein
MSKVSPMVNNFSGGEVSPKLDARVDLQKYGTSCITLENMIPLIEGGAVARPGTYYVGAVKDSTKKVRLLPFQFSTTQAYIVEAGEYYFRFYKDNAQIVTTYTNWGTGTAYLPGNLVIQGGNDYRCLVGHTSGVFATDLAAGYWAACSPTTGEVDLVYEIPSPYEEAELADLKITQSADVLYIAHRNHNIRKLSRTGHTLWTLTNFISSIDVAMTISAATQADPCVVTASLGTGGTFPVAGDTVYIDGIVGMTELNDWFYVVANPNSGFGTFELAGIDATGFGEYTSGGTATRTQFGTTNNCPGAIAFFEQRFMAGGTTGNPLDVYGSASSDFENFKQNVEDSSSGLQFSLLSDKVDGIRWMLGEEFLLIGTQGGIWRLGASSATEPLTMDNVIAKRQIASGVKDMDAEMVNDAVVYVQRGGTTVRRLQWDYSYDKYISQDLTRIAKHITKGSTLATSGITDMDYQSEPFSIVWSIRADGTLLGMTYEPTENIMAWFRCVTDGDFESVACISSDGFEDQVWVVVSRTIGGATKRYIEYFKYHDFYGVFEDAFYVDSGLSWSGGAAVTITNITQANPAVVSAAGHAFTAGMKVRISGVVGMTEANQTVVEAYTVANPVAGVSFQLSGINSTAWSAYASGGTVEQVAATVSGLSHLEGESVAVLTDLGIHGNATVASGAITLGYYANEITTGLPYTYSLQPMKIEPGSQQGSSKGKIKRIYSLMVSFYETWGAKWGPDADNLTSVPFGVGVQPATLFTGDKETDFDMDFDTGATVYIQGQSPLPMTVLAVSPGMVVE